MRLISKLERLSVLLTECFCYVPEDLMLLLLQGLVLLELILADQPLALRTLHASLEPLESTVRMVGMIALGEVLEGIALLELVKTHNTVAVIYALEELILHGWEHLVVKMSDLLVHEHPVRGDIPLNVFSLCLALKH